MVRNIGERTFSAADQDEFAALSGDWNPIHVDPLAARRTLAGEPIVHGCHTVLWALERFFATGAAEAPSSLEAVFQRPIYLNTPIAAVLGNGEAEATINISVGVIPAARLKLGQQPGKPLPIAERTFPPTTHKVGAKPEDPRFEQLSDWSAGILLGLDPELAARRFPLLWKEAPGLVGLFCALSRVVGMECPGLRSLFSRLSVRSDGRDGPFSGQVVSATRQMAPVKLLMEGEGVICEVDAFFRPAPVRQPSMEQIARHASARAPAGSTALIIGGSRGLGEASAKLAAAAGSKVVVTYSVGSEDAERVAEEISSAGGAAYVQQLDIRAPDEAFELLRAKGISPTHLFYFATPRISGRRTALFDSNLFDLFSEFYVAGFVRTVEATLRLSGERLRAFYPSSVFVDAPPQGEMEYAAAKAAGETVARSLGRQNSRVSVMVERLPRTATDQTATILGGNVAGTADVMAPLVAALFASER